LVLLGEAGAGKTCAALLLAKFAKTLVFFSRYRDWCDRLRWAKRGELQSLSGFRLSEVEVWDEWRRAQFAVLDDIGARREISDHAYEALIGALDRREGMPTVYTSNLSLEEFGRSYDDRVASRLSAGTLVYVEGDQRVLGAAGCPDFTEILP
jgi:DNA replication protein DnaC